MEYTLNRTAFDLAYGRWMHRLPQELLGVLRWQSQLYEDLLTVLKTANDSQVIPSHEDRDFFAGPRGEVYAYGDRRAITDSRSVVPASRVRQAPHRKPMQQTNKKPAQPAPFLAVTTGDNRPVETVTKRISEKAAIGMAAKKANPVERFTILCANSIDYRLPNFKVDGVQVRVIKKTKTYSTQVGERALVMCSNFGGYQGMSTRFPGLPVLYITEQFAEVPTADGLQPGIFIAMKTEDQSLLEASLRDAIAHFKKNGWISPPPALIPGHINRKRKADSEGDVQPTKKAVTDEEKEVTDPVEVAGLPTPRDEEPMDEDSIVDPDNVQEPTASVAEPTSTKEQPTTTESAAQSE